MPDLVTLLCPSCGGKLQVAPNATSLKCQHCGNEHMVKHEAGGVTLEAYARCPQCGRNDKAEKVTAVLGSQSQEISGMEQKTEVVLDALGKQQLVTKSVPFTRKQISVLGQRLAAPGEPQFEPGWPSGAGRPTGVRPSQGGIVAFICGAVLLIVSVCFGLYLLVGVYNFFSSSSTLTQDTAMVAVIGLVGGFFFFLLGTACMMLGIYLVIRTRRKNRLLLAEHAQRVQQEISERERVQSSWIRAMVRWNQLYYCARDDCVFIPGENTSAPLSKLKEYLYP
jgi:predicted RNA-binding Zn-ribbon protein involved in translation (DUF1610 family)